MRIKDAGEMQIKKSKKRTRGTIAIVKGWELNDFVHLS